MEEVEPLMEVTAAVSQEAGLMLLIVVNEGVEVTLSVTFPVKAPPPVKLVPAITWVEEETLLLKIVQSAADKKPLTALVEVGIDNTPEFIVKGVVKVIVPVAAPNV